MAIMAIPVLATAVIQASFNRQSSFPNLRFMQNRSEFKPISSASGIRKNGVRFDVNLYESSDGIGLSQTVEIYSSPARANAEVKRKIKRATKILERSAETDSHGRIMKQRIVALYPASGGQKAYAGLIGTDGAKLYSIESTSLDHVLKFSGTGRTPKKGV
jgi:hypothetical protein